MEKDKVIELLDELYNTVQELREEGNTDLRTVLYYIGKAKLKVSEVK